MAKKQTRRSISVSRTTYERLKAFCEANNISMSQFVETRVGDFLGEGASAEHHVGRSDHAAPDSRRRSRSQPRPAIVPQPVKHESRPASRSQRRSRAAAGPDDVGRGAVRRRAAAAGDQAEAAGGGAEAGREAPRSDLHVLIRSLRQLGVAVLAVRVARVSPTANRSTAWPDLGWPKIERAPSAGPVCSSYPRALMR